MTHPRHQPGMYSHVCTGMYNHSTTIVEVYQSQLRLTVTPCGMHAWRQDREVENVPSRFFWGAEKIYLLHNKGKNTKGWGFSYSSDRMKAKIIVDTIWLLIADSILLPKP